MHNRRDFFKYISGLTSYGIFASLTQSCLSSNQSELEYSVEKPSVNYYFQINLFGSPARWTLDSFLNPFESEKFKSNSMVGTVINTERVDKYGFANLDYVTVRKKGIEVPYLWSLAKKENDFTELLGNMIAFRGCDMKRDGHEFNNRKLVAPTPGELSITGQISDLSDLPIPVVHLVGQELPSDIANSAFKAKYGTYSGTLKFDNIDVKSVFNNWFLGKNSETDFDDIANEILPKNLVNQYQRNSKKAQELISKSFDDIYNHYVKVRKEYQKIIDDVFATTIPNISDFQKNKIEFPFYPKDGGTGWDVTWVFAKWLHGDYLLVDGWETAFSKAKWNNLSDQFAITEALVKFGVTQSAVIIPNSLTDIFFECIDLDAINVEGDKIVSTSKSYKNDIIFELDSHNSGSYLTLVANSYMQLILMNCLNKFVSFLKSHKVDGKSLFDMSLVHVTSEFEREPANSQKGSEHGWNGHSSIFYSGIIKGPHIVGNIEADPKATMFKNSGTWGAAAPMKFLDGRNLEYGNITSSIAKIIGFPTPTPNRESMVEIKNGEIKPLTKECKNI